MERVRILQSTAERYRMMAGTITDQDIARRLLDYADELRARARQLSDTGVEGDEWYGESAEA